ncbi:hypothetical protein ABZ860_23285 [Microbispora sp. NPDC046973]|uniref:hypothetical protein n=1 Tax=Microbispora sp. NPDC046973 TaxID=3155022 RepID=UPI003401786B
MTTRRAPAVVARAAAGPLSEPLTTTIARGPAPRTRLVHRHRCTEARVLARHIIPHLE